jgi:hypothetical protein
MIPGDPTQSSAGTGKAGGATEVRIYQHSPILYWWVIWAYGFFCALLTYAQGSSLVIGDEKPILVHPSPWVGLSFTMLLLLVILATSVRARGVNALFLILLLLLSVGATYVVMNTPGLFASPPSLLVHMNLAFYMMISSVLFVVWFVIVFFFDRTNYWRFRSSQVERVQKFASVLGRAPEGFSVMNVKLIRHSDDLLAHKILGLGIFGLGTSDIDARMTIIGGGSEHFRIENVWRASLPLKEVQALMGPKATVVI